MSIYCTIFDLGYDHKPRCKRMRKTSSGVYQQDDSQPCTCGKTPIHYTGSHVLPANSDMRAGSFDLGAIPGHITRDGRDDRPATDSEWYPWLRIGLCGQTVLLTKTQVEQLRDVLSNWLENASVKGK